MAAIKNPSAPIEKVYFCQLFEKVKCWRQTGWSKDQGPLIDGPDFGSNLFATVQNTAGSVSHLKWVNS